MKNSNIDKTSYKELMDLIKYQNSLLIKNKNYNNFKLPRKNILKRTIIDIRKRIFLHKNKTTIKNNIENTSSNYFSNEKIAIYTCVFGNYDQIYQPLYMPNNCDFYIFTDDKKYTNEKNKYKKKNVYDYVDKKFFDKLNNTEKNRYIKMNPQIFFSDYKYSIYIDGNIQLVSDMTEYIHELGKLGIGIHSHSLWNCVYDEAKYCLICGKIKRKEYKKTISFYEKNNMPKNFGLYECGVIVREHNNPKCIEIMNEWWNLYKEGFKRDQLVLPYVIYKKGYKTNDIKIIGTNIRNNSSYIIYQHK